MSLLKFLAPPLRRTLRAILSLSMSKTADTKPQPPVLPRLSTRVAAPRETN